MSSNRLQTIRVLSLCLAFTAAVFLTTPLSPRHGGYDTDGLIYAAMAGSQQVNELLAKTSPWCYRILTPSLVAALPFETLTGFRLVAFLAVALSLVLMYRVLQQTTDTEGPALFGLALYAGVFWTVKFPFFAPAYIDHVTQLFLVSIVYLTLTRRYLWLLPVFALAALQRESLVVYSLFSVWHLLRTGRDRPAWTARFQAGALMVVPVAVLLLVRTAIEAEHETGLKVVVESLVAMAEPGFWPAFLQAIFSGMGMIPVLLLWRPQIWLDYLKNHTEWLVYLVLSVVLLLGGADKARLLLYGLPAWVLLATQVVESLSRTVSRRHLVLAGSLLLIVHALVGGYLTGMGSYGQYLARWVPMHAAGAYRPYLIVDLLAAATLLLVGRWWLRPASNMESV